MILKQILHKLVINNNLSLICLYAADPTQWDMYDEDIGSLEVMRKPDLVKKQRLMDTQYDYFDFQAKKNAMAKNMPVR